MNPQISSFEVFYLSEYFKENSGIEIRWVPEEGANISAFKLYRSKTQEPEYEDLDDLDLLGTFDSEENSYKDLGGTIDDFYAIATVDSDSVNSDLTDLKSATDFVPPVCRIVGVITGLRGERLVDVKVSAKLIQPPKRYPLSNVVRDKEVYVLTNEEGKFSLPVLQGAEILFEINGTQVSDPLLVPEESTVAYNNLDIYEEYQLNDIQS